MGQPNKISKKKKEKGQVLTSLEEKGVERISEKKGSWARE